MPRSELYQCRGCDFVHRFPSKVRRHFHYRHSVIPPYRCGHCSYRAVERGKVVKHCQSAHPSRRLAVLSQDDEHLPAVEAAFDVNSGQDNFQRPGDGRKPYDMSSLRNISKPSLNSSRASGLQATSNCDRAKNAIGTEKNKPAPSSESLSSKEAANDDSLDESDDSNDYESSDEYEPPGSKKKSDVARRAQLRGEVASNRSAATGRLDSESGDDNEEDRTPLTEDDPTCDHIPCETIFAINRTTYRPFWRSQTPSDREDSNSNVRRSSGNPPTTVQVKTEPVDDYEYQSATSGASTQASSAPVTEHRRELPIRAPAAVGTTSQRQYYCVYCGLTSKWNRRDVRLHVMHVHVGVRAFSCGHCGFGNSKNRAIVRSHCAKSHPGREMLLIDNEPVFEAIDSVQDQDNLISIAFTTSDGTPLLTLEELDEYLSSKGIKFRSPTAVRKTSEPRVLLPDPETVRETIRSSLFSQSQSQDSVNNQRDDRQLLDVSRENLNASESMVNKDQTEELNCQWKCRQCDFRDLCVAQVESHIVEQHLQLKPYGCPHCRKYFLESEAVLFHIDEDHAGSERHVVSTAEEKSNYIRRNIQCVSVEVESAEFQTDRTSSVQGQSSDAVHSKSNLKDSALEKDPIGVPSKSSDEEHSNNVHSSKQAESLVQTVEISPTVKNAITERRDTSSFSNNILSSNEEERYVNDDVPPTLLNSSAEQEELKSVERNSHEGVTSVDNVQDFQQVAGENSGDNQSDSCNDLIRRNVPMASHVEQVSGDAAPKSVEEQGFLEDSSHGKEQTGPVDNLSANTEIAGNEENDVERVSTDGKPDSFKDSSRTDEQTQQPSDAPVLSTVTSNVITDKASKDAVPLTAEEQVLPSNLTRRTEHSQRCDEASLLLTNPCDGGSDFGMINHAERNIVDGLAVATEEQKVFKKASWSIEQSQQSTDTLALSTTSDTSTDEENDEVWKKNSCEEETADLVTAEHESLKTSLKEHDKQNYPTPQTKLEVETAHEQRNENHVENSHLASNQVLGTDSSSVSVQESQPLANTDAYTSPQEELPKDRVTANPPDRDEDNFGSVDEATSRPTSKEHSASIDSNDKPFPEAATNKLDSDYCRLDGNPVNESRPSSNDGGPRSVSLKDDDGLSSDSSSSDDDNSTWRCDDCSFVATSETLLVAHQRSRQQYRCLYCPDFNHSSVVHMRHHCLTRHPGKPISYKHTELPCSEIKTPTTSVNSSKVPAISAQSANAQTSRPTQSKIAETALSNTVSVTKPAKAVSDNPKPENSDENYCMDLEESSSEESDNSEDDDWEEYVPKKKSKMMKKNKTISKTPNDAGSSTRPTAGPEGSIVCDLCNSYSTANSTVMRHHVMSHLQYYPYFCPHCTAFRSVRSFPIIKHIRMKHRGKSERFECNPDPEMEKKVRESSHRVKSGQKEHRMLASAEETRSTPPLQPLQPLKPVENKTASSSKSQEPEEVMVAVVAAGNKNRKILYKCKICGLKTHLRGDFRHHVMRELHYKPFK